MLHLLYMALLGFGVGGGTTTSKFCHGSFRGRRFGTFRVWYIYTHLAVLDLSSIGGYVSFFTSLLPGPYYNHHAGRSGRMGTCLFLLYSGVAWLTFFFPWGDYSAETVAYFNIRVQQEGLNKAVLEGELYGGALPSTTTSSVTKSNYALVDRGGADPEIV